MKNKFIRLFAYLCFTLIFMSCNNIVTEGKSNSDLKSGNVIISLKSEPARTITPVNGKSYLDVAEWTVTFKETSSKLLLQYNTIFPIRKFKNIYHYIH